MVPAQMYECVFKDVDEFNVMRACEPHVLVMNVYGLEHILVRLDVRIHRQQISQHVTNLCFVVVFIGVLEKPTKKMVAFNSCIKFIRE